MKLSTKITISLVLGIIAGIILNVFFPLIVPGMDQYVLSPEGKIFLKEFSLLLSPSSLLHALLVSQVLKTRKKLDDLHGDQILIYCDELSGSCDRNVYCRDHKAWKLG